MFRLSCEPCLGVVHIPEEVRADMDRGLDNRDPGELVTEQSAEGEPQKNPAHGEDFGERVVGRQDLHVLDLDRLFPAADRAGRLGEREVGQRGVDLKRNIGRDLSLVLQADHERLQDELRDFPRGGGMGRRRGVCGRGRQDLLQGCPENQLPSGDFHAGNLVLRQNSLCGEIEVHPVQDKKIVRVSGSRNPDIPCGQFERRRRIGPRLAPIECAFKADRWAGRPELLAEDFGVIANDPPGRPGRQ